MRRYSRDDVETHYGSNRPAVNVKVYGSPWNVKLPNPEISEDARFTHEWIEANISEETMDDLFWMTCRNEWEMIEQDAEDIFGKHVAVEADGRSGGWAVVTGLPEIEAWDAIMLAKWRKFERFAKAIAADVPYQMLCSLALNDFEAWADEESERLGAEAFEPVTQEA